MTSCQCLGLVEKLQSLSCSRSETAPHQHSILYYGHYARRTRKHSGTKRTTDDDNELNATERKTVRRRWANLIRRVFQTDPLICDECGGKMRVVSFITEPRVIRQILDHLQTRHSRDPPPSSASQPRHSG